MKPVGINVGTVYVYGQWCWGL